MCCVSGEEALEYIPRFEPNLVLMDMRLPGMSGFACTQRLKSVLPGVKVVVITGVPDSRSVVQAAQAGADGYLCKPFTTGECLAGIAEALAGELPLSMEVGRMLFEELRGQYAHQPAGGLTEREQEVLQSMTQGLTEKEISARLHISDSTVRTHAEHIRHKLGVRSRAEVIIKSLGATVGMAVDTPQELRQGRSPRPASCGRARSVANPCLEPSTLSPLSVPGQNRAHDQ